MKFDGLDKLIKDLDKKQKKAKKLDEKKSIRFEELFNKSFMKKHSKYDSISKFFEKSPFEFENEKEFRKVNLNQLNQWVKENSSFKNWEDMKRQATIEYIENELEF